MPFSLLLLPFFVLVVLQPVYKVQGTFVPSLTNTERHCNIHKNTSDVKPPHMNKDVTLKSEKWSRDSVEIHNRLRSLHGSPPLRLNSAMCESAMIAAKMYLDEGINLIEVSSLENSASAHGPCSESIWISKSMNQSKISASAIVMEWYLEGERLKRNVPNSLKNITAHHFSNLIWRDSKEACVVIMSSSNSSCVVAQYYPFGALLENLNANVQPNLFTKAGCDVLNHSAIFIALNVVQYITNFSYN